MRNELGFESTLNYVNNLLLLSSGKYKDDVRAGAQFGFLKSFKIEEEVRAPWNKKQMINPILKNCQNSIINCIKKKRVTS